MTKSIKSFTLEIAIRLHEDPTEEKASQYIRAVLVESYNKPPMTEEELQAGIANWIKIVKKAIAEGGFFPAGLS